jgi:hypothetical protein
MNTPSVPLEAPDDTDLSLNKDKKAVSCCKLFNDFDDKENTKIDETIHSLSDFNTSACSV